MVRAAKEHNITLMDERIRFGQAVTGAGAKLAWLQFAGWDGVRALSIPEEVIPYNVVAADSLDADVLWPNEEGTSPGLTGAGVVLGIFDGGGLDGRHPDFEGRTRNFGSDGYIDNCEELSAHATSVGGTMVGSGGENASARGVAYGASWLLGWPFCGDAIERTAEEGFGVQASNHSYGAGAGWIYDSYYSQSWVWAGDETFESAREFQSSNGPGGCRARSLSGSRRREMRPGMDGEPPEETPKDCSTGLDCTGADSIAKNVLVIGGIKDYPEDPKTAEEMKWWKSSSVGPADDGRVKPDLVANSTKLLTLAAGGARCTNPRRERVRHLHP